MKSPPWRRSSKSRSLFAGKWLKNVWRATSARSQTSAILVASKPTSPNSSTAASRIRARVSDPVHFVESLGFWLVTRHDDVKRLFNDPDHVSHDKRLWERHVPPGEG